MKKTLIILMMVLLCAMLIISCAKEPKVYEVTFDLNGGSGTVEAQAVEEGEKATKPAITPKSNDKYKIFSFWSSDGKTEFKFDETTITADTKLKAIYRDYEVGDKGPAGGIIFYVNSDYDADSSDNNWMYMEVASSGTTAKYKWSTSDSVSNITTSTEVGKGKSNTNNIKNAGIDNYPAAKACVEYNAGGYTDWFLPSKEEVTWIYTNIYLDDDISNEVKALFPAGEEYWTSSLAGNTNSITRAHYEVCTGTNGSSYTVSTEVKVRPVRSF